MALASHYIFLDLLNLQNSATDRLREVCEVYGRRYSDDEEFQEISNLIISAIEAEDNDALTGLEPRLRDAVTSRKMACFQPGSDDVL